MIQHLKRDNRDVSSGSASPGSTHGSLPSGTCLGMQGHPCAGGVFQGQGEAGGTVVWIRCPRVALLEGNLGKLQVDLACPSMTWWPAGMTERARHKR